MSKLGELIDYTGEECPNCGRVRVEQWSCGKRICEKCHWCIEDNGYLYDDDDEDEDYLSSVGFGKGKLFLGPEGPLPQVLDRMLSAEKERLTAFEERAEKIGLDGYEVKHMALTLCMDADDFMTHMERMIRTLDENRLFTISLYPPEPETGGEQLTDAQIRKQLKYEKNPMRVKQLNKMLYGKRKK